jgi:hypothetical protein
MEVAYDSIFCQAFYIGSHPSLHLLVLAFNGIAYEHVWVWGLGYLSADHPGFSLDDTVPSILISYGGFSAYEACAGIFMSRGR